MLDHKVRLRRNVSLVLGAAVASAFIAVGIGGICLEDTDKTPQPEKDWVQGPACESSTQAIRSVTTSTFGSSIVLFERQPYSTGMDPNSKGTLMGAFVPVATLNRDHLSRQENARDAENLCRAVEMGRLDPQVLVNMELAYKDR